MNTTSQLFDIAGQRAVVTGGASGIGEMIARGFVAAGASVIVASRKEDSLRLLADELSESGTCSYVVADLATEAGCRELAERVGDVWDSLEILVNNAGATWGGPIENHDSRSWRRVLDVNVEGMFHTTKSLLPLLRASGDVESPARVINIGSVEGMRVPSFETYSYAASKAAVHQMTRHLAKFLAPVITVNAIAPGPFPSRMMRSTLDALGDDIVEMMPLRRIGRPDDMVGAAIYLASRAGSFLTGAVVPVDGGLAATA